MSIIAQLGRVAAQQMMKQAVTLIDGRPVGQHIGPDAHHDLAQSPHRDPQLPRGAPNAFSSGRAKYRNVSGVPGGGGSMWGDQVVGRGGAHPDSAWADEMINSAFGAGRGPIGQPFKKQQDIQSKRLLAQDPRGRGGWASTGTKTHAQQKAGLPGTPNPITRQIPGAY